MPFASSQRCFRHLRCRLPLIGKWLRRRAAQALARDGSPVALHTLAEAVNEGVDHRFEPLLVEGLKGTRYPQAVTMVANHWMESGNEVLARCLIAAGVAPGDSDKAGIFLGIKSGELKDLSGLTPTLLPFVLEAAGQEKDADLHRKAVSLVEHTPDLAVHDSFFRYLGEQDDSVALQSALDRGWLPQDPALRTRVLILARQPVEPAPEHLDQEFIDRICRLWEVGSQPAYFEELIVRQGWMAAGPPHLRGATSLLSNHLDALADADANTVPILFAMARGGGPSVHTVGHEVISQRAKQALANLRKPSAQEAVCRRVLEQDCPIARQIAVEGKFKPSDELDRARFYMLTGQWEAYGDLDYDLSLARRLYLSADERMQARLTACIRESGRPDLLEAALGLSRDTHRFAEMSADELSFLMDALAGQRAWDHLFRLVFELPLVWSMVALHRLLVAGWQPTSEADRAVFDRLAGILRAAPVFRPYEVVDQIPLAVRRAEARVEGNVNAVAFSPSGPLIAIGTGHRKLALWNFQSAAIEQAWGGFDHSIGRIAFRQDGAVLAAERTNLTNIPCRIYRCLGAAPPPRLGEHRGSITGLEACPDGTIISSGRDGQIVRWHPDSGRPFRQRTLEDWPRFMLYSGTHDQVLVSHSGATILDNRLFPVHQFTWPGGIARTACFAPDNSGVIGGKVNGEIVFLSYADRNRPKYLRPHRAEVTGLATLARHSLLVSACASGEVAFHSVPRAEQMRSCRETGWRLTSLNLSPDGAFMVLGDSDHHISFWDIRGLEVANLLTKPLNEALPRDLAAASSFKDAAEVPDPARPALRFLETLLRHSFRYDIEISEPVIRAGPHDIQIADLSATVRPARRTQALAQTRR